MTRVSRENTASSVRIYGFDFWRAALLIVGPLVHAGGLAQIITKHRSVAFADFNYASHDFRMPAFFMIAGYLAAHTRKKQGAWYERRLVQLGVPLAFTLFAVLIPIEMLCTFIYSRQSDREFWGYNLLDPQHLWFLITLISCHTLVSLSGRTSLLEKFTSWRAGPRLTLCAWIVVLTCVTILSEAIQILVRAGPFNTLIDSSANCAGTYFLGFYLVHSGRFAAFARESRVGLLGPAALVAAVAAYHIFISSAVSAPSWQTRIVMAGFTGIATTFVCISLFYSAVRITSRPRAVASLSDASYSIYLLHYPIIILLGTWRFLSTSTTLDAFAFMASVSFVVCYFIHILAVRRFPVLAFLLNGKRPATGPLRALSA